MKKGLLRKTVIIAIAIIMVFAFTTTAFALDAAYSWDSATDGFPLIKRTATGTYVRTIQRVLNDSGYTLTEDGSFGPATQSKVKTFQTDQGITVDGKVGRDTWGRLQNQTFLVVGYNLGYGWLEYRGVHSNSDSDFRYMENFGLNDGSWFLQPYDIFIG